MSTFGKSQYGERLDFSKRKCTDGLWTAIYITHVIGLIYSIIHIYIIDYNEIDSSQWSKPGDTNSMNWSGCFNLIPVCILSGVIIGVIWLFCIQKFSKYVIQAMMLSNIVVWSLCFVVGLATFNLGLLISGIIIAVLYSIHYIYVAFFHLSFSSKLIAIGNYILTDYFSKRDRVSSLVIATTVLLDIGWLFLWGSSFYGYILIMIEADRMDPDEWIIFLYLLSLYWGLSVNASINHHILSAVIASWYFAPSVKHNISANAICNTWTKQSGSVCLGAALVPFVAGTRAILDAFVSDDKNSIIGCMCLCCTNCMNHLYGYFNTYAFTFMALYGHSFTKSSADIHKLLDTRGMNRILVADMTGTAMFCASLVSGVCTAAVAYGIAFIFYGHDPDHEVSIDFTMDLAIYGGIIGLVMCLAILRNVRTAIIAVWVCFAENPSILERHRPKVFAKLMESNDKMNKLNMQLIRCRDEDEETGAEQLTDTEMLHMTEQ